MSTAGQGQITVEPTTAETEIIVDVDRLIDELDVAFDRFPEETLRSCQRHRQLVIPRLIEVLQEAARLGQDGTEREGNAPLYALFLLSEFQATEALPAVVEFLSLPNKIPEEFLGDAVTEDLPRILATLAIGREEILDVLIGNANLNEYVRSAAIRTYEFLVRDQRMERRAAVERLRGHLSRTVSEEHVYITSCLILSLGYLNGVEAKDEIHAAFEQDMVDEWFINERDIDEMLHPDQPDLCPELDKLETTKIEDTVEELRNWYWPGDREPQPSNVWRGIDFFPFNSDSAIPYTPDLVSDDLDEDRTYAPATIRHDAPHVGRNEPCPCGSGKKYKKCCLRQNRGE